MRIGEFQGFIKAKYYATDSARGAPTTFLWFVEEVGELATAIAKGEAENLTEEFADVLAWLCTLANLCEVDLEGAVQKYTRGQIQGHK